MAEVMIEIVKLAGVEPAVYGMPNSLIKARLKLSGERPVSRAHSSMLG